MNGVMQLTDRAKVDLIAHGPVHGQPAAVGVRIGDGGRTVTMRFLSIAPVDRLMRRLQQARDVLIAQQEERL